MDPFLQKKQMCTPQQATALTESVLQMLIYDMRLRSMVDGAGFRWITCFSRTLTVRKRRKPRRTKNPNGEEGSSDVLHTDTNSQEG